MKKTVTIEITRGYPDARPVTRLPFRPIHLLAYTSEPPQGWQHPHFSAVLQQHDAFDAYILLLEIRVRKRGGIPLPLRLPLTTHRNDLHALYQLSGHSVFRLETGTVARAVNLGAGQYRQLCIRQLWAVLDVQPDKQGHYLLADVVVKEGWLSRHLPPTKRRYSKNQPITPAVLSCLFRLFGLRPKPRFEMDTAVHGPVGELMNLARSPSTSVARPGHAARELVSAVQALVRQQVVNGLWPHPQELADAFTVHPKKLQRLFPQVAGGSLQAYISGVRMQEAWRRLAEEKQPPAAVAFGLGYLEQAAFNHQFKKHFGITPGEARAGMPRKEK